MKQCRFHAEQPDPSCKLCHGYAAAVEVCRRKRAYSRKAFAKQAAKRHDGKKPEAYRCDVCGMFHLRSRQKQAERRKRLEG